MKLRRLLAGLGICLGLAFAGCGGSEDPPPAVAPAPDTSAKEKRLEDRIAKLRDEIDAQQSAREKVAKERADEAGKSGDGAVDAMLGGLPGSSGLAVGAPGATGPEFQGGSITTGDAWSTIKVPIAAKVLADAGGPNRLPAAKADQINRAITLSDNDAAAALFQGLEQEHGGLEGASRAVGETLRESGDSVTVISTEGRDGFSTYGQTDWSLADQFRFMAALAGGCVGDSASRNYLLGQMSSVGGSDTFGIGAAGFPAKWKGGWGPGTDGKYLVRQMGVMDVGGKQMVLAMAAIPDDGSFESGQEMLSQMARWVASNMAGRVSGPAGC